VRRAALLALLPLLCAVPARAATPRHVSVRDGFTITGTAGSQAVIHLTRPLRPPGRLKEGPPVTLTASFGDVAGLAIVGRDHYDTVIRALPSFVCGARDCGTESYDTDADTDVAQGATLPAGDYTVVLVGAPGARVTATVAASYGSPVRVPVTATARPEVTRTTDAGSLAEGAEQQEQGTWSRQQTHHRALVGVVHVVGLQYGNGVSYDGSCPGHASSGTASLINDKPGPVPLGLAWTPMYAAYATFCPSDRVEETVTASWQGTVQAARATQRGVAVYVPLVAR
jgi:hypothetical protein